MKRKILPFKCVVSPQTMKPGYRLGGSQMAKRRCTVEIENALNRSL